MFYRTVKLDGLTGLMAGARATLDIDAGRTFHEFYLKSSNLTPDDIESVTLELNGDPIVELDGNDLVMLEQYRKRYVTTGFYTLYLTDIVNDGMRGRNISALVTFPTDNLNLKVKVRSVAKGGPVTPNLEVSAMVSAAQAQRIVIPRKYKLNFDAGQTNENTWSKLQAGPAVQRIHFNAPITRLEWRRDGNTEWERDAALNEAILKRMDRAPQAGYFHFDAIESDFGVEDLFDTVRRESLVARFNITTPGNVPALVEAVQAVPTSQTQV